MAAPLLTRRAALAGLTAGATALALPGLVRAQEARRLVIAGGDLTEMAFALGLGEQVAAVDTTSMFPPAVLPLPKIGYLRQLAAEGVLSTRPDLVILAADAGPPPTLDRLRAAGVQVEIGPEGDGPDAVSAKLAFMGRVLEREAEAEALNARFLEQMAGLEASLAGIEETPSVLCLLSAGRGAPMAAGTETAADVMITLARGRNAVGGYTGYKPLSAEVAIAAAPDYLLLPQHAVDFLGGPEAILARPEIAATPAGREGRLIALDGMKLLGFGLRTPQGVAELASALHPGLDLEVPA